MILGTRDLDSIDRNVVMVDGSFDPIHEGHIAYFCAAANLGLPVLCNIAPDSWTRSKHAVLLSQHQRALVIDAIRYVGYVHTSELSTCEVLNLLKPSIYAKGNDWLTRGGIPEKEMKVCQELGIKVVYLDTVLNSSSALLNAWQNFDGTNP